MGIKQKPVYICDKCLKEIKDPEDVIIIEGHIVDSDGNYLIEYDKNKFSVFDRACFLKLTVGKYIKTAQVAKKFAPPDTDTTAEENAPESSKSLSELFTDTATWKSIPAKYTVYLKFSENTKQNIFTAQKVVDLNELDMKKLEERLVDVYVPIGFYVDNITPFQSYLTTEKIKKILDFTDKTVPIVTIGEANILKQDGFEMAFIENK